MKLIEQYVINNDIIFHTRKAIQLGLAKVSTDIYLKFNTHMFYMDIYENVFSESVVVSLKLTGPLSPSTVHTKSCNL